MSIVASRLKRKWQAFLDRLAQQNNQTFDGGKPSCCSDTNKKVTPKEVAQNH